MVNHTDGSTGQSIAARPDINRSSAEGFVSRAENPLRKMRKMRKFGSAMKGGTPDDVPKPQSHTGEG
jgi:hypothetical protein